MGGSIKPRVERSGTRGAAAPIKLPAHEMGDSRWQTGGCRPLTRAFHRVPPEFPALAARRTGLYAAARLRGLKAVGFNP